MNRTPEQIRLEAGLNQEDLAELAGVSDACVSRIESGKTMKWRATTLLKIGNALVKVFKKQNVEFTTREYIAACIEQRDAAIRNRPRYMRRAS